MNEESHSTSLKISMSSVVSNPISDKDIFEKENLNLFKIIATLIIIDFIFNELIIINDCHFLKSLKDDEDEDPSTPLLCIFTILSLVIFCSLLLLLYVKKVVLSKLSRFFYLKYLIVIHLIVLQLFYFPYLKIYFLSFLY